MAANQYTQTIRFINVDDDESDRLSLKNLASAYPALVQVGECSGPEEAIELINTHRPDLVFLDIEMPGATGVRLLRAVKSKVPMVVFITSDADYALEGFELNALDYMLKPCTEHRFTSAFRRVEEYWEMKQKSALFKVQFEKDTITIKEGRTQISIPVNTIRYCEAMQDYTKIVTPGRSYLTLITLADFFQNLDQQLFIRVHRSYVVNISEVRAFEPGKLKVAKTEIPIGKAYRSTVNGSLFKRK